jgi:molybdenum cofactor cytidylyltransferase
VKPDAAKHRTEEPMIEGRAPADAGATGPVVGLLLAAGVGRRFDAGGRRNKLLARLPDGQTIVAAAARTLCSTLDHVAIVVPSKSALLEAALSDLPVRLIRNTRADQGMGTSIAAGIAELQAAFPNARGWLIALGDMPFIAPGTIHTIGGAVGTQGAPIVAACHGVRRGHPVAFDRALSAELAALDGDVGANVLMARHGVRVIECNDPGVLRDIDTPGDLLRAPAEHGMRS